MARHGDKCACGATLIASQFLSGVSEGGLAKTGLGALPSSPASLATAHLGSAHALSEDDHLEQFFVLLDDNGHPVTDLLYRLDGADGAVHEGALPHTGATRASPMSMTLTLRPTFWRPMGVGHA